MANKNDVKVDVNKINEDICSVYCPCINDTVPMKECNGCPNYNHKTCHYEEA